MATRSNTSTRTPISQLFLRRNVDGLIHEMVSPVVDVDKKKGKYYIFDNSNTRIEDDIVSSRFGANETDHDYSTADFDIQEHGLKEWVDADVYDDADDVLGDGVEDAILNIKDKLLLAKEKALADLVFASGNFSGKTAALTGTNRWDNASSNPLANFKTAATAVMLNSGKPVNALIMGYEAMQGLQYNERILSLFGNEFKTVTVDVLKRAFANIGLPLQNIIVGTQTQETAGKGLTSSQAFIWGKSALFAYIDPNSATRKNQTLVKTFRYKSQPMVTRVFNDPDQTKRGKWVYGGLNYGHKLVSSDCGYLFTTVVS